MSLWSLLSKKKNKLTIAYYFGASQLLSNFFRQNYLIYYFITTRNSWKYKILLKIITHLFIILEKPNVNIYTRYIITGFFSNRNIIIF